MLIIIIVIALSYFQSLPTVGHIPATFEFKLQQWMPYVPRETEYVAYVNYEQAFSITHNSSLFGGNDLFELPSLGFRILPMDITYEVVIQLPEPQFSGSTTLLRLTSNKEAELANDLGFANITKVRAPFGYDGYQVHVLLMRKFGDQESTIGFMAIVNQHIIFSNDKTTGLQNVETTLNQISSNATSLFDDLTVRTAVYATGVTDQNYAALFVGKFPTQLNDTRMAVKSIIGNGNAIVVSRALLFPTSEIVLERFSQAHQIYRDATSYRILDSWLVVQYDYPLSRMQSELIGI